MNTETATDSPATEPDPRQQTIPGVPAQQLAERKSALDRQDIDLIGQSPFASLHAFTIGQRMAQVLASSSIVPNEYRQWVMRGSVYEENPSAVGNCFIALELANRLNISPLTVMQQVDMIHGRPALRGKLMIALVNGSRHFAHDLRFECSHAKHLATIDAEIEQRLGAGEPLEAIDKLHASAAAIRLRDDYGYRAWTTSRDGTVLYGPWITWKLVKAEGWSAKKDSKWGTIPELMFQYRAASWWSSLHATHITLGLYESEELRDIDAADDAPTRAQLLNRATELPKESMAVIDNAQPGDSDDAGPVPDKTPQEELPTPKPRGSRRKVRTEGDPPPETKPADDPPPGAGAAVAEKAHEEVASQKAAQSQLSGFDAE